MPKFARGVIDLEEAYGDLLDKQSGMARNIRTKTLMGRTHHCEDKECGGVAPKAKCIQKLHFAFCLAPVVDMDPESPTFEQVVIHGERFVVLSPSGCAEHPYSADFNLDIKDARNGRSNFQVRWKEIFEKYKSDHEANKIRDAKRLAMLQKQLRMTGHQKRTLQARQDDMEFQQRKKRADIAKLKDILEKKQSVAKNASSETRSQTQLVPSTGYTEAESGYPNPGELAVSIGAVTDEEVKELLMALGLYSALFEDLNTGQVKGGEMEDSAAFDLHRPAEKEVPVATTEWLEAELYRSHQAGDQVYAKPEPETASREVDNQQSRAMDNSIEAPSRRKDTKQAKKQRAAETRAIRRTLAIEIAARDAEEEELAQLMKTRKAIAKKGPRRTSALGIA